MNETELGTVTSKTMAARLLGTCVEALGLHGFLLECTTSGVVLLAVTLIGRGVTCGNASGVMTVIGLIKEIIALTMTPQQLNTPGFDHQTAWL